LFHLKPLGVAAADPFPIDQNTGGVEGVRVDERRWRHCALVLSRSLSGDNDQDDTKPVARPVSTHASFAFESARPPISFRWVV
jgi:hypothetical protein